MHEADVRFVSVGRAASRPRPGTLDSTHHESGGLESTWSSSWLWVEEGYLVRDFDVDPGRGVGSGDTVTL